MRRSLRFGTLAFVLMSCANERDALARELAAAEERWTRANVSNYRLVLDHRTIGHVSRAELVVVGGAVVSAVGLPNDRGEMPFFPAELLPTIDQLFENARLAIAEAHSAVVEFDARLGYPLHLRVDYAESVLDDEAWFRVRELTPLLDR